MLPDDLTAFESVYLFLIGIATFIVFLPFHVLSFLSFGEAFGIDFF